MTSRSLAPDTAVSRETLRREVGRCIADQAIEQLEIETRYAGYIDKQQIQVGRSARAESTRIPAGFDYNGVRALSFEARQVLSTHRPETVGAAARLPGVTPASISLLLVELKKRASSEKLVPAPLPSVADA